MIDHRVNPIFHDAQTHFDLAKEELGKPKDDVVPYSVCQNAFHSIKKFLTGFLMARGYSVEEDPSVEYLIKQSRSVDNAFEEIHLAPLYDPTKTEDVWMNRDTADDFMLMAKSIRQLVVQRSNLS